MDKILKLIEDEMKVYEDMESEATTAYERGETAGALSALRHLSFLVRSLEVGK